jgi:hypothetical protein
VSKKSWLFGPGKQAPKRVRVYLVPDSGQESLDWNVPFVYFRILVLVLVIGLLALLFLIFSSGSLMMEKQQKRVLQGRLDDMTIKVARVNSLEIQLEETTMVLLKIQGMLGLRDDASDSLLQGMVAARGRIGDTMDLLESDMAIDGRQMLQSSPSVWPIRGWITRSFQGKRGDDYHPGLDLVAEEGTPIRAAGDGIVLVAGWNEEYGNFVVIEHGFGLSSLYAHNNSLTVQKEDRVKAGDAIAFLGNTGRSTGAHLHFEVRRNGIAVDPRNYLLD